MRRAFWLLSIALGCSAAPAKPPAPKPKPSAAKATAPKPTATASAPPPAPAEPAFVPLTAATQDMFGDALPKGALRRFGTRRARASTQAKLIYTADGELLVSDSTGAGMSSQHVVRRDDGTTLLTLPWDKWRSEGVVTNHGASWLRLRPHLELWNLETGKLEAAKKDVTFYARHALLADGEVAGFDKSNLTVWKPGSGTRVLMSVKDSVEAMGGARLGSRIAMVTRAKRPRGAKYQRESEYTLVIVDAKTKARKRVKLGKMRTYANFVLRVDEHGKFALLLDEGSLHRIELDGKHKKTKLATYQRGGLVSMGIDIDPTSKLAAVVHHDELYVYDLSDGSKRHELDLDGEARAVALSPKRDEIAVLTESGRITRYDARHGDVVKEVKGHRMNGLSALSPSGERVVTAGGALYLWDTRKGTLVGEQQVEGVIHSLAFIDEDHVVTLNDHGFLARWKLPELTRTALRDGKDQASRYDPFRHMLAAAPDTKRFVAHLHAKDGYRADGHVGMYGVTDAEPLEKWPSPRAGLALSPDGARIALVNRNESRIIDVASGKLLARHGGISTDRSGSLHDAMPAMFSPSGALVGSCQGNGLLIWDHDNDVAIRRIPQSCTAALFLDESSVLIGDREGELRRFDVRTGAEQGRLHQQHGETATLSRSPLGVLVGSNDGTALMYGSWSHLEKPPALKPSVVKLVDEAKIQDVVQLELFYSYGYKSWSIGACVRTTAGTLSCWGDNDSGRLGLGDEKPRLAPEALALTNVTAFDLGERRRGCAVAGGSVFCWGGDATQSWSSKTPKKVQLQGLATAIAVREEGACALVGGRALCWTNGSPPTSVAGVSNATAIAAGVEHTCALIRDGTVRCWGDNSAGQLGFGRRTADDTINAVLVKGLSGVTRIGAGGSHSCAVRNTSEVWCWGNGYNNENGDGTFVDRALPNRVAGVDATRGLAVGRSSVCALGKDAITRCWGRDMTLREHDALPAPTRVPGLDRGRLIATSSGQGCVLTDSDQLRCWGAKAP